MTDQPDPTPTQGDAAEAARIRRNKLIGRAILIGMGLLVLAQVLPILLRVMRGGLI